MAYAFIHDVPVNEALYEQIRAKIGAEVPAGLVAHLAIKRNEGLRYIDVWDSREDWERFREERVGPAVDEVLARHGIVADQAAPFEAVEVVDVWLGAAVERAR